MKAVAEGLDYLLYRLKPGDAEAALPRPADYHYRSVTYDAGIRWIAYARVPLGIDAAPRQLPDNFLEISTLYFSVEDQALLTEMRPPLQAWKFTQLWSQYEAQAKYKGVGLKEAQ